jgi:NADH/NAD ratio-sensing transcriptional regulator Rex
VVAEGDVEEVNSDLVQEAFLYTSHEIRQALDVFGAVGQDVVQDQRNLL